MVKNRWVYQHVDQQVAQVQSLSLSGRKSESQKPAAAGIFNTILTVGMAQRQDFDEICS